MITLAVIIKNTSEGNTYSFKHNRRSYKNICQILLYLILPSKQRKGAYTMFSPLSLWKNWQHLVSAGSGFLFSELSRKLKTNCSKDILTLKKPRKFNHIFMNALDHRIYPHPIWKHFVVKELSQMWISHFFSNNDQSPPKWSVYIGIFPSSGKHNINIFQDLGTEEAKSSDLQGGGIFIQI